MVNDMNINDVFINYVEYGRGEPIVFFHGWGQNIEMMQTLAKPFSINKRVIIIDLPGHGQSSEPKIVWSVLDFVEAIHQLLVNLKVKNPIIIGHSFGGKIGLLYASKYEVKKLICLASPFKKQIEKLSLKTKVLKTAKKVPGLNRLENFAKKHIGSTDYRNASGIMREILVSTVNCDITEEVKKITCPTLLIWGTLDQAVPLADAYELEKLIKDSGVVVYEGCTHYAYLERLGQTIKVIESFIG